MIKLIIITDENEDNEMTIILAACFIKISSLPYEIEGIKVLAVKQIQN
jgi:hypothetical protein